VSLEELRDAVVRAVAVLEAGDDAEALEILRAALDETDDAVAAGWGVIAT
jgi:hypothetical protein